MLVDAYQNIQMMDTIVESWSIAVTRGRFTHLRIDMVSEASNAIPEKVEARGR